MGGEERRWLGKVEEVKEGHNNMCTMVDDITSAAAQVGG